MRYLLFLCLLIPFTASAQRSAVSAKEVTGTFRLKYKGTDLYSEARVIALGNNTLYVEFDFIRPKINGDAHFGWAKGFATIDGDSAVFRERTEMGESECRILMKFTKPGVLVIPDEYGRWDSCGFGYGVTGSGTYKKISGKRPNFERPEDIPERDVVSAEEVTGTYRLKDEDRDNEVQVLALGDNKLQVEFMFITSIGRDDSHTGWASGVATIEGDRAHFRKIIADEEEECFIPIKFTKPGELYIGITSTPQPCDFGVGINGTGTYKKVSSTRPKFSK